ncbi:cytochrome b/b6 domain-containing protein [Achromobacter sp. NCFB-sbj8-Ac1-l]|uniref:cytochrome b/b6 domain-containing protein n=1 Tax=unclassified Achromobacter TaxID=2626865 RepID=UPI004046BD60
MAATRDRPPAALPPGLTAQAAPAHGRSAPLAPAPAAAGPTRPAGGAAPIHPGWLRITHWLNALAVVIMVTSGWRIYNAAPFFDFAFPNGITLGGWLGGALQWHFAGMWLLLANGLLYLGLNLTTGRLARKFFPVGPRGVLADLGAALRGKLSHADPRHYNQVQRLAYLFVIADITVLILSGLVLWKSVQFDTLRALFGGYEFARRIHFFAMALLVAFVAVHLAMVALVPRSLIAMIRGK